MMPPARLLAMLPAPMKVILVVMGKEVPAYKCFVFQLGDKCPPKTWRFRDEFVTAGRAETGWAQYCRKRNMPFCRAAPACTGCAGRLTCGPPLAEHCRDQFCQHSTRCIFSGS